MIGANTGGVLVRFGRLRAIVPQSHLTSMPRGASEEERCQAKERLVRRILMVKVIDDGTSLSCPSGPRVEDEAG